MYPEVQPRYTDYGGPIAFQFRTYISIENLSKQQLTEPISHNELGEV